MIGNFFHTVFYAPLYNGLIYLIDIMPWADVGLAVIVLTIVVKLILLPMSVKMAKTQIAVRQIDPEVKKLKERFKNDQQKQAEALMQLYRDKKINPFSGILLLFIQLPIIFALYWVFFRGGLPVINTEILYSFVPVPETVNMFFLGLIDMAARSFPLALGAGITQYLQGVLTLPPALPKKATGSFKDDMARGFQMQMRYVMPVIVFFVAYAISSAVALYWFVSNTFMIAQELLVRRRLERPAGSETGK
jgi:YidC/Oxa1 family membrane protein insertase